MATRLYFHYGDPAPVDVSAIIPDAAWEDAASVTYHAMSVTKRGKAMTTVNVAYTGDGTNDDVAVFCFVSPPLSAAYSLDTTNFDPTTVIRCAESNLASNSFLRVDAYIVPRAGTSIIEVDGGTDSVEMATSLTVRGHGMPWDPLYTTAIGDRIALVVGFRKSSASSYTQSFSVGDDAVSDLTNDDADTGADNPYVELVGDYVFLSESNPNQLMLMGVGV